jgi:CBS domain-containing protein
MAATFGSPVSAVLLAIELLLFEYRPRSIIPVALAAAMATAVRAIFSGTAPVFPMPDVSEPHAGALATYVIVGMLVGVAAVWVTRAVYAVEDAFEELPIHWMWWPAIGAVAVGVCGYFAPHTLGVGYDNIEHIVDGHLAGGALAFLCGMKLISWMISLASGTSGGTLAPLFTIGGGLGVLLGAGFAWLAPSLGIDPRVAGLVGMAAMFAGASRALLASVVFAFETTRQPLGLLPLLGGCTAAYLYSCLAMRNTIMTEKIARRGVHVAGEYVADFLATRPVKAHMTTTVVTFSADESVSAARQRLAAAPHQGFPVVDKAGAVVGVVTRRELETATADGEPLRTLLKRPALTVYEGQTLRDAVELMARAGIGRLPVVAGKERNLVGILTRADLVTAESRRLKEEGRA